MKALHFHEHGDLSQLQYGEVEDPSPKLNEVIVQVKACAINHLDLWVLQGWPGLKLPLPHIGGADISGVIKEVGGEVQDWEVGARVVVNPGYNTIDDEWTRRGEDSVSPGYRIFGEGCRGGFAEYVAVPAKNLLEMPDQLGFTEAAAPLLVSVTAWRMLVHRAKIEAGETVLIVGAGGGLNSFALRLCKHLGAKVIALTSSQEKMQRAKDLGADQVLNYRANPRWGREILSMTEGRGVDVVVDNVGAHTIRDSILAVRRGGRIVTVGNTSGPKVEFDNRYLFTKQISLLGSTMGSASDFRAVTKLIWENKIQAVIDRELALADGKVAYELLENGDQFGKVVLVP